MSAPNPNIVAHDDVALAQGISMRSFAKTNRPKGERRDRVNPVSSKHKPHTIRDAAKFSDAHAVFRMIGKKTLTPQSVSIFPNFHLLVRETGQLTTVRTALIKNTVQLTSSAFMLVA
jgi:hypothetical protein